MHILIAPNAFKNSLSATAAAEAIQSGLIQSKLSCTTECFPIGDGGDGTAELIIKKCGGIIETAKVHDPLGRSIVAPFGLIDNGKTAVIEMADASGLRLLKNTSLAPLYATSAGTGELIVQALNRGVNKVILGMGGSATIDGGTGILSALGVRFLDSKGEVLDKLPASLVDLATIDISNINKKVHNCCFTVLCDVDNMLLGENGSAGVFGPQKGASANDVKLLEAGLATFAAVSQSQTGKVLDRLPYGGTAGGAAAGLFAFLNAELVNGIDHFLQLTHFNQALEDCDLVITGEGSIDDQTLQGKGPFGVAKLAKRRGKKVIGLAGKVPLQQQRDLKRYFNVLLSIGNEPSDIQTAMENTTSNLVRTSVIVGELLSLI